MSREAVEAVIGRALMDAEFRKTMLANPEKALASFDLTEAEKEELKRVDDEAMNEMIHTLDQRVN